ncbi:coatomer gamma 2-subunit [Cyclospora cayetanensis]|uniref:Coatomer gamma 2-subunit n=1 Tax=Cyclospora cayetanensis TaxID=88456 RepID=A0A1D3CYA8_9EIME|nr:coatomer gamma 2-subunit [Cyclospora cayetanensis]
MLDASTFRSKLQRTLQLDLPSFGVGNSSKGVLPSSRGLLSGSLEGTDKGKVLQDARCFSVSPADPVCCARVVAKVLYLLQQGVQLTAEETSVLFFGLTRLFHCRDEHLRGLVYLLLRRLPVSSSEGFVVTSSLTRDATDANPNFRASALRCLCTLADAAVTAQTERYVRTAFTDASSTVASAASLCGIALLSVAPEAVKRWSGEAQGCIASAAPFASAFGALSLLCSSGKSAARFAATRTLSQLSGFACCRPYLSSTGSALEVVLSGSNKMAAATAVAVLLKTASESSIDRLMRLVSSLATDAAASEPLKLSLIASVVSLSLLYPKKHKPLLAFLSACLREEGSLTVKTAAIKALLVLLKQVPAAREACLSFLCEFIEDCEYPSLCSKVLCLLGDEAATWSEGGSSAPQGGGGVSLASLAGSSSSSGEYLRHIFNRIALETSSVRAAGVDALAKVGKSCSSKRDDVLLLLAVTAATDPDDEVRDRAFAMHRVLSLQQKTAQQQVGGDGEDARSTASTADGDIADMLQEEPPVALECLCSALVQQLQQEETANVLIRVLAASEREQELVRILDSLDSRQAAEAASSGERAVLHASCTAQLLTEEEAEYGVEAVLHVFSKRHAKTQVGASESSVCVLMEWRIRNTLESQTLADVLPRLSLADTPWQRKKTSDAATSIL